MAQSPRGAPRSLGRGVAIRRYRRLMPTKPQTDDKILTRPALLTARREAHEQGRRVVHCHGCFDIVHPGHIRHLRQAKALGDLLLVSITGDTEMAKGTGRPLIPEELRAENLAALDFVDWVHVEQRETAAELLDEVAPDVYVKGQEYETNNDPRFRAEREAVERHGGRVVFSSGDVVFSSTALIAAMETSVDPSHTRLTQLLGETELEAGALMARIASFRSKRVLVVGESIVDTYVHCDRPDIAGESPIMTLRPLERRYYDGGAAVVALHAAAMGAKPTLVTALPHGDAADSMVRRLTAHGVDVRAIRTDTPLAEKQRYLVGAQKVMKVDQVEPIILDARQQDELVALAATAAAEATCHVGIISDFAQGLLSRGVLTQLCKRVRPSVDVLVGDVSGRRAGLMSMRQMDLLCPSESELRSSMNRFDEGLPTVAWRLLTSSGARAAIVTMGADGLVVFERRPGAAENVDQNASRVKGEHVPALCPIGIDPLGCGDALATTAALTIASGGSHLAAGFLGAVAAAAQVQRLGNLPVSSADLRRGVARIHASHLAYAGPDLADGASVRSAQKASALASALRAS